MWQNRKILGGEYLPILFIIPIIYYTSNSVIKLQYQIRRLIMAEVGTFMPFVINKSIYALDTRTGQIWANKIKMGGEHGAHFVEDNSWSKYSYPSIEQELEEE